MARLYLGHNVSHHVVDPLRIDHDVRTTRDAGLDGQSDEAQLLTAVLDNRVLVTHDRADFTMLHDAWLTWPAAFGLALPAHPGILLLDSVPYITIYDVLAEFFADATFSIENQAFWWHRRVGWRRRTNGVWEPYR